MDDIVDAALAVLEHLDLGFEAANRAERSERLAEDLDGEGRGRNRQRAGSLWGWCVCGFHQLMSSRRKPSRSRPSRSSWRRRSRTWSARASRSGAGGLAGICGALPFCCCGDGAVEDSARARRGGAEKGDRVSRGGAGVRATDSAGAAAGAAGIGAGAGAGAGADIAAGAAALR